MSPLIRRRPAQGFATWRYMVIAAAVCLGFAMIAQITAQSGLPRNALWEVVQDVCLPAAQTGQTAKPCVKVDLDGGVKNGYVVLKDLRGASQYLLIPTEEIAGIESPEILAADAPNYFEDAWQARTFVEQALNRMLPRDDMSLAINSIKARSQDQLHIHVDCVRPDVRAALHKNEAALGPEWTELDTKLAGRRWEAMWVPGEELGANNPFQLLADDMPGASKEMGFWTLVVVGYTRGDGTKGFVILSDKANIKLGDEGAGEDLQDHACRIASLEN